MTSINQVGRWLGALAVVGLLGIDEIEQEGHVEKPIGIDPVQWAAYNESQARNLANLDGLPAPEPGVFPERCDCSKCEACKARHAEARSVVYRAMDAAFLRGEGDQ